MSSGPTLTKASLADHINHQIGISKKDAGELVDDVLDLMRQALLEGEKVKIPAFGSFVVRDKSARRGRNPHTGEKLIIARRRVLTFKPSQRLRQALNPDR
ncbi:MAG: integration host factor subunit alpha [Myxococcota bacterium]